MGKSHLREATRAHLVNFELLRDTIVNLSIETIGQKKLKDRLLSMSNNILTDMLIFYDLIYSSELCQTDSDLEFVLDSFNTNDELMENERHGTTT